MLLGEKREGRAWHVAAISLFSILLHLAALLSFAWQLLGCGDANGAPDRELVFADESIRTEKGQHLAYTQCTRDAVQCSECLCVSLSVTPERPFAQCRAIVISFIQPGSTV